MAPAGLTGATCLVTGASGFIGRYLCEELNKQGAHVKALLRSDAQGSWDTSFVYNLGDQHVPDEVMQGVEVIFHLAGRSHSLSDSSAQDKLYFQTNVEGTRSLLESAKAANINKFIFFSSVKSMGEECDHRLDETTKPNPTSIYGKSKLEAEKLVCSGGYVSDPTVLRLAMVYGDSDKGNLSKMIKAVSKNRFPPFPEINNKRSMIHVEDVVQAAIKAASSNVSSGEIYILTDGIDYSTRQIYENICISLGKNVPNWSVPKLCLTIISNIGDVLRVIFRRRILFDSDNLQKLIGNSFYDNKKIKSDLGFSPKHTLFTAMPDIISSLNLK